MARSVNIIFLLGNLGADPKGHPDRNSGKTGFTTASLATTHVWKNASGEEESKPEWHQLVFFGRLAEIAERYCAKGTMIHVIGRMEKRKYTDKDGQEREAAQVVVKQMEICARGRHHGDEEAPPPRDPDPVTDAPTDAPGYLPDDDIPF